MCFCGFCIFTSNLCRLKNQLFLLLCLLWLSNDSMGSVNPGFDRARVFIRIPSNINAKKYTYELSVKFVNKTGGPFGSYKPTIKDPGQVISCEIWKDDVAEYEDTLLNVQFSVHRKGWEVQYVHHQVCLKIHADSVFYAIPELPEEDVLDSILEERGKIYRKEQRREDFKDFMTNWKSYLLEVNFHQGNRSYGELSFSNARYNKVTPFRYWFKRYHPEVPGFIRGPVYGAEFNFLWVTNEFIVGPKIGFQITNRVVNLGLSAVYYTDFTHGVFCLKPRIGLNPLIPWVNFSYEYAIRCSPDYFGNRINRHQLSVYFLIPLRLKETSSFL